MFFPLSPLAHSLPIKENGKNSSNSCDCETTNICQIARVSRVEELCEGDDPADSCSPQYEFYLLVLFLCAQAQRQTNVKRQSTNCLRWIHLERHPLITSLSPRRASVFIYLIQAISQPTTKCHPHFDPLSLGRRRHRSRA